MIYEIEKLRSTCKSYNGYKIESILITRIEKYINDSDIINIYVRNLFLDDKVSEFYIFTKYNLAIFTYEEKGNHKFTNIVMKKLIDVSSIEISNDESNDIQTILKIKFNDGYMISFDNLRDTNEHHSDRFRGAINDITTQLINI